MATEEEIKKTKKALVKALDAGKTSTILELIAQLSKVKASAELLKVCQAVRIQPSSSTFPNYAPLSDHTPTVKPPPYPSHPYLTHQKTEIGKTLGKLRAHPDTTVSQKAKEVVKKWKDEVQELSGPAKSEGSTGNSSSKSENSKPETSKPSSTNNLSTPESPQQTKPVPAPVRRNSSSDKIKVTVPDRRADIKAGPPSARSVVSSPSTPPETPKDRSVQKDEIRIKTTGMQQRDRTIELLYSAVGLGSFVDADLLLQRATKIEEIIFENFAAVNEGYKNKVRSLIANLKAKGNPGLRESVVSGELSVKRLCAMSKDEMMSEEAKTRDRKLEEEALFRARGAGAAQAETDMFLCGRCKGRKCTYFQMQTRSADEPMTTFVTCTICDNHWK
ncbi:transcription elongation factor S-II, partial [Jimgerdemannia flammicorona]